MISLSKSAYITSRIIIPFHKSCHVPQTHSSFLPSPLFELSDIHYFIATVCKLNASTTTLLHACFGSFRPLVRLKFSASPFPSFWSLHFPRPQESLKLKKNSRHNRRSYSFVLLASSIHHTIYCKILRRI